MNNILDRQNQPELLKILCASRMLYNKAETLNHWIWGLTIVAPLISVVLNAIKKDTTLGYYLIITAVFLVSLMLEFFLQRISKKASSLRVFFCDNVLGFGENKTTMEEQQIYETAEKTVLSNRRVAQTQMMNSGKDIPPGVKDWYEIPLDCAAENAVFACQKCDAWWDTKIRKKCAIWITAIMIGVVIVIALGSVLLQCSFPFLLYSSLGLIGKTVWQADSWVKYYNLSKVIDGIIESMSINRTKQQEQHLQHKLNERRSLPVFHLNQVYKKMANKLSRLYGSVSA